MSNLRNPNASDLFVCTRMLGKIGVKNIFKKLYENEDVKNLVQNSKYENGEVNVSDAVLQASGMIAIGDILDLIFEKLELVQDDLFELCSRLSGLSVKDISNMEADEFAQLIIDIIQLPKFKDFMRVVLKSFK